MPDECEQCGHLLSDIDTYRCGWCGGVLLAPADEEMILDEEELEWEDEDDEEWDYDDVVDDDDDED